jgi:hypothetical protein
MVAVAGAVVEVARGSVALSAARRGITACRVIAGVA